VPAQIDLPETFHPVIRRVLAARQVNCMQQLDYSLQNLLPYHSLRGIERAASLLAEALIKQERIMIVADYDADGATSCALAMRGLQQMGGKYVDYLVPNREKHGYGLSPQVVELALAKKPQWLLTVDNGIASHEGVQAAKQQGLRVLVTDHHVPPEQLPNADVIVNPKQPGDNFPSKELCGVGVIFYVMMALRAHLRERSWFKQIPLPNLANFLDLVALGTVADVVALDYNNRILVEQGLRRIRAGQSCHGIKALLQVTKSNPTVLVANDLAFGLGPRLNAAGRMEDMSYGIACLLSEDEENALKYAQLLSLFNQERRAVEAEMQTKAWQMIETLPSSLPVGFCLFEEGWHEGVIGILAARLKDYLHRPTIAFTASTSHPEYLKGSGRSIQGVHLRDVLADIQAQQPKLITKFGGHALAAGLLVARKDFEAFQQAFDKEVQKYLSKEALEGVILSDGALSLNDLSLELAEQLRNLTPWGQSFPEPIFDGEFELLERRVLKDKHLKMQVRSLEGGGVIEAVAFHLVDKKWPLNVTRVQLAYKLDVNRFRGFKNVQLLAEYVRPMEELATDAAL